MIADRATGKLYVGAAYGEDNFWQKWSMYAQACHGNNKQLKELYDKHGSDYFKNFNFSILEIFKNTTDVEEIQKRENYWKKVLLTREFGYNDN